VKKLDLDRDLKQADRVIELNLRSLRSRKSNLVLEREEGERRKALPDLAAWETFDD
jgi:hypothetical protein